MDSARRAVFIRQHNLERRYIPLSYPLSLPSFGICQWDIPKEQSWGSQPYSRAIAVRPFDCPELIYGAEKSLVPEKNLAVIEGFVARLEVLSYDADAADAAAHTGMVRAELARAGTPIGPSDQMIAGHARSKGLIAVTNNVREFERIQGLRIEDWVGH